MGGSTAREEIERFWDRLDRMEVERRGRVLEGSTDPASETVLEKLSTEAAALGLILQNVVCQRLPP